MAVMTVFGLGSAIMLMQPVPVDFRLDAVAPPAAIAVQRPAQLAGPDKHLVVGHRPHAVVRSRPIPARGFGRDVPLDFAVRQLVPASMHVTYGATVDRQIRVSWQGGKPWQQVLHAVLVPLGLRVTMSGRNLKIAE